jgi:hypothetical protein
VDDTGGGVGVSLGSGGSVVGDVVGAADEVVGAGRDVVGAGFGAVVVGSDVGTGAGADDEEVAGPPASAVAVGATAGRRAEVLEPLFAVPVRVVPGTAYTCVRWRLARELAVLVLAAAASRCACFAASRCCVSFAAAAAATPVAARAEAVTRPVATVSRRTARSRA